MDEKIRFVLYIEIGATQKTNAMLCIRWVHVGGTLTRPSRTGSRRAGEENSAYVERPSFAGEVRKGEAGVVKILPVSN